MNVIHDLPPHQQDNSWIGLDTEIYQLNSNTMHRPTSGKFACLTIAIDDDVYFIDDEKKVPEALIRIENSVWIIQNAKFDLIHLKKWAEIRPRKKLWDTMLIDRIMWGGYFDHYSLEDLARRYLDLELDKSTQKYFETASELNEDAIHYAAQDAWLLPKIVQEQKKQMSSNDFKIWKEIDLPALWAVMDFTGFPIDTKAWMELAGRNKQRQDEIDAQLPFNPRSPKQVVEWMKKNGFPKIKNSQEETLQAEIWKSPEAEAARIAQLVLDSRMYGKRVSSYGASFIQEYVENLNGWDVIYPNFDINAAESGRFAARNPAIQTVPGRETTEFRDCFVAPQGWKLIVADWKAQEPCITAYLTQDKRLTESINSGRDVYIEMAKDVFGEKITKKSPRRGQIKSLFLGAVYGLSPYGLAKRENLSVDEAERLLNLFFSTYTGVRDYVEEQSKQRKFVYTVPGRKVWLNAYSDQCPRNAMNAPIQGTGSEMMKKALISLHQSWPFPYLFGVCNVMHDEIEILAPDDIDGKVAIVVKDCMENAGSIMCPGVNFKADVAICNRWSEKS